MRLCECGQSREFAAQCGRGARFKQVWDCDQQRSGTGGGDVYHLHDDAAVARPNIHTAAVRLEQVFALARASQPLDTGRDYRDRRGGVCGGGGAE